MNLPLRSALGILCLALGAPAFAAPGVLSKFDATSLTGEKVTEDKLLGQPTVLIVTPSRDAAEETRKWAQALMGRIDPGKVRVRDVIALDLPFFMSESDALGRARDKIPQRYHDMTWLSNEPTIERAFDIPRSSGEAFVLVLGADGQVRARVTGAPTGSRVDEIVSAVQALRSR